MQNQPSWTELVISQDSLQKLWVLVELIQEWNARINLTGFRSKEEIQERLLGPAVLALAKVSLAGKSVLDFGSGAGIPGLVWAICEKETRVTSVEIRHKKIAFQKEVVRATGVQAEVLHGMFPDIVANRAFDVVASRAIRFSPELWEDALEHLNPGGLCVRFAGADASEDGWQSVRLSEESSLLIRKRTN